MGRAAHLAADRPSDEPGLPVTIAGRPDRHNRHVDECSPARRRCSCWAVAAQRVAATRSPARAASGSLPPSTLPGAHAPSSTAAGAVASTSRRAEVVFAHNADLPLEPASNEKLAVTYAALAELGPAYRFRTEVLGEGQQVGDAGSGRLVLKGYGDPTLTPAGLRRLARHAWRGRHPPRHRRGRRRRVLVRQRAARRRAGSRRSPASSRRRSRRSSSTAAPGRPTRSPTRRSRPRRSSTQLLRARGIDRARAVTGRARRQAATLATVYSQPLAATARADGPRERQLHRRDAPEGDRRQAIGARHDRGRRRGRRGATSAAPACRSPACGSSTARGSRARPRHRAASSSRCSSLMWSDPTLRSDRPRRLPVAGESGTLERPARAGPARGVVRARPGRRTSPRRSPATSAAATPSSVDRERRPGRTLDGARRRRTLRDRARRRCCRLGRDGQRRRSGGRRAAPAGRPR